ncbi:TetR family transcriptional regulator [uncultured Jatrophihabitans sp.]|uniref:TetR family transcriptional regulator n=1 Tax=uncultured Jatrophihabitans sp. TaxID=1610747 RepID=UPI0035CA3921
MPREGAHETRDRVIAAAVSCIHEVGLYRATSNAIAQRAGVSWGVIQYHFGSRESLMLAVVENGARRYAEMLSDVVLTAETTVGRVEQCFAFLADYHGSTGHLAVAQVMIDLARDPNTSAEGRKRLTSLGELGVAEKDHLGRQILQGNSARMQELRDLVFFAIQGVGIGYILSPGFASSTEIDAAQYRRRSRLIARAVALLIDEEQSQRAAAASHRSGGRRTATAAAGPG